jgi:hypothetical protein
VNAQKKTLFNVFFLPSNPEKKSCTHRLISLNKIFSGFLYFFIFVLTVFTVFFSLFSLPRKCTVYIACLSSFCLFYFFCLCLSVYRFFCFLTCPVYRENTLYLLYSFFSFLTCLVPRDKFPFNFKITCINKAGISVPIYSITKMKSSSNKRENISSSVLSIKACLSKSIY